MCFKFQINHSILTLFWLLFSVNFLSAQSFSVLTCSRGEEIYSTFGHSAIRYQDSSQGIDWVYNYGLFEFSDPNFIPKFCMGKLDYMVGKESMNDFMGQYIYQRREVKEQMLSLRTDQRDSLLKFLEWNIQDENKYYRYDFLFNNCATKIIDVIEKNCKGIKFQYYKDKDKKSFRELIHINARNTVPWIDWGMDLALGIPTDKVASDKEYCFLPEYVAKTITLSSNGNVPLNLSNSTLIQGEVLSHSFPFYMLPIFWAIGILVLCIYHKAFDKAWSRIIIGIFFIVLGIGGFIIGFEWFFTEHAVTKNNWNLGWLNPVSLVYGLLFIFNKENKYIRKIVGFGALLSIVAAIFKFQDFHLASILLMTAIFVQTNVFFGIRLKK